MKKFLMCLFIGLFILTGEVFAVCACCGAETTVEGKNVNGVPVRYKVCTGTCGTSCNSYDMCSTCGKCYMHCVCPDDPVYGGGSGSSTYCSFINKCSKTHCDIYVCSDCGRHRNDEECGGDCNTDGYCSHCRTWYCSLCNNHTCTHNRSGYCSKPHCTSRVYCSKCGHYCTGDHRYASLRCGEVHCDDLVCTVSGCNVHKGGVCGGGHTDGTWKSESGVHNRYCGRTDLGCTTIVDTHDILWGAPDDAHTSTCMRGCGLTYTHTPIWGEYFTAGDNRHTRSCTVTVGDATCQATDTHTPSWSGYVKSDNGGEESGASHLKRCTVSGCKLTGGEHVWPDNNIWRMLDEENHKRECPTCGLTQVLKHDFVERIAIADDIEKHYKVCALCVDAEDNKYKTHETHVDKESGDRGNGICDLCNKELWRVTKSTEAPTNSDVIVQVEMFSDHDDRIKLPEKMLDEYGNEFVEASGRYTIGKNGQYSFVFECPDREIVVNIDNISKNIYGKVFITPDTATTGNVTLKLVTSTEGIDKEINVKFENESWQHNTLVLERVVTANGEYKFYAEDSLGNTATFIANVNNIVSGFGSVTTTFDVFQNGYIFTDILVNVNQAWILDDALVNCLEGTIYKVDETETTYKDITFNKVQIMDSLGNNVTNNVLSSGAYYVRVAIGGANVFKDVGTYMAEVKDVTVKGADNTTLLTLFGKNRIEVVVQSLNDLT